MYLKFIGLTFVLIFLMNAEVEANNYCSLCKNHVACGTNGVCMQKIMFICFTSEVFQILKIIRYTYNKDEFGRDCSSDVSLVKMDAQLIGYILKLHNEQRNELALGKIQNYKSAAKMPTLVSG